MARTDRALWFAFLAPPLAWSIDSLVSITIQQDYCASRLVHVFRPWGSVVVPLFVVGLAALLVSLYAGMIAWRTSGALAGNLSKSGNGRGATVPDRQRFMAHAALLVCGLFTFGIILRGIAPAWIPSALCQTR